jgi:hypothetical protein
VNNLLQGGVGSIFGGLKATPSEYISQEPGPVIRIHQDTERGGSGGSWWGMVILFAVAEECRGRGIWEILPPIPLPVLCTQALHPRWWSRAVPESG